MHRKFHQLPPNELWVIDITGHPAKEGKNSCCAVLDAFLRRIVFWPIDDHQDSSLVVDALDMAIQNRRTAPGGIVHADHGVQSTSWDFTRRIREASPMPSCGTIGVGYDNAIMKALRFSMQIQLSYRKRWRTRANLANLATAILE